MRKKRYPCKKELVNFLQKGISAQIICMSLMMKIEETAGCATSLRKLKGRPAGFVEMRTVLSKKLIFV